MLRPPAHGQSPRLTGLLAAKAHSEASPAQPATRHPDFIILKPQIQILTLALFTAPRKHSHCSGWMSVLLSALRSADERKPQPKSTPGLLPVDTFALEVSHRPSFQSRLKTEQHMG